MTTFVNLIILSWSFLNLSTLEFKKWFVWGWGERQSRISFDTFFTNPTTAPVKYNFFWAIRHWEAFRTFVLGTFSFLSHGGSANWSISLWLQDGFACCAVVCFAFERSEGISNTCCTRLGRTQQSRIAKNDGATTEGKIARAGEKSVWEEGWIDCATVATNATGDGKGKRWKTKHPESREACKQRHWCFYPAGQDRSETWRFAGRREGGLHSGGCS